MLGIEALYRVNSVQCSLNKSQICWRCNWCWAHKMKLIGMIVVQNCSRSQEFRSKTMAIFPIDYQIKVVWNKTRELVRLSYRHWCCAVYLSLCVCVYVCVCVLWKPIAHLCTDKNVKSIQITNIRIHVHVFFTFQLINRCLLPNKNKHTLSMIENVCVFTPKAPSPNT